LRTDLLAVLARIYDPGGEHATDPLAWPYHASADELVGLPPHVVSVNELDPLRDEGLAYARRLAAAGVSVVSRTVNGTSHAADVLLPGPLSEVYAASVPDVAGFVHTRA
jgi:acetyl esterase